MFEKLRPKRIILPLAAAAITALGVGGIALAQNSGASKTTAASEQSEGSQQAGEKRGDEKQLTGPDATRAKTAALAKVGSGKVTAVSAEKPNANEPQDATDAKDPTDKAAAIDDSKIAYDVEVTKPDSSVVDVFLDASFAVLGTETDTESGEHADEPNSGEHADGETNDDGPAAKAASGSSSAQ
jgi:hypothetical protein